MHADTHVHTRRRRGNLTVGVADIGRLSFFFLFFYTVITYIYTSHQSRLLSSCQLWRESRQSVVFLTSAGIIVLGTTPPK